MLDQEYPEERLTTPLSDFMLPLREGVEPSQLLYDAAAAELKNACEFYKGVGFPDWLVIVLLDLFQNLENLSHCTHNAQHSLQILNWADDLVDLVHRVILGIVVVY